MTATSSPPRSRRTPVRCRLLVSLALAVAVVGGGATAAPALTPGAVDGARAGWTWPLQPTPRVVRSFDPPTQPWLPGHRGVDLAGAPGQPVLAPTAGVVRFAGQIAGRGVVVVEHGELRLTFEPVSAAVRVGAWVRSGTVLGHLRLTQSHCRPAACLHWGVKRGDTYLDPLRRLGAASGADVILLPLAGPLEAYDPVPATPPGSRPVPRTLVPPAATTATAGKAVRFAAAQVGDPYVWGAAGPDAWDCSGLTMAAWQAGGQELPHYSAAQYAATTPVPANELRPGDLVFWAALDSPDTIFHVALYVGGGLVVHAPRSGESVRLDDMNAWDAPDYFGRV
ncbi:MAG: NlpC/P60 family protein [Actinomycetota bacterium]|nr:NlpC/P60 family protein [Actinomycetota bacterium]